MIKGETVFYKTQRLLIRPTSIEDAPFIFKILNSPKWIQYIGDRNVKTEKEAADYIKLKMLPQFEKLGYSNNTIIRKHDNVKIGTCGLYNREGIDGVDIGFAFLPEYEKQGYAYESAKKVMEIGVRSFGLNKINAITTQENKASQKLIEKLGLKYVKKITIPNDTEELLLYCIEI